MRLLMAGFLAVAFAAPAAAGVGPAALVSALEGKGYAQVVVIQTATGLRIEALRGGQVVSFDWDPEAGKLMPSPAPDAPRSPRATAALGEARTRQASHAPEVEAAESGAAVAGASEEAAEAGREAQRGPEAEREATSRPGPKGKGLGHEKARGKGHDAHGDDAAGDPEQHGEPADPDGDDAGTEAGDADSGSAADTDGGTDPGTGDSGA